MQEKNNEQLLTILTVNYKTSDFIDLMLYAFHKLTKNSYKVIICDNYSSEEEVIKITDISKKYNNVEVIFRYQTQKGSIGHAEAMDLLVSKVNTSYFVTMDSDCTFLLKNWDEKLILKLDEKCKVIGTTLHQTKDFLKHLDFPLVFAVLYETETYKKLNPSFMPGDIKEDRSKDTGWEIRKKYIDNEIEGFVFKTVNTKFECDDVFKDMYCSVYYLEDLLIASHFARGSSGGVPKYSNKWFFKIPILSKFIRRYIGLKEKNEWIKICKNIVNSQK